MYFSEIEPIVTENYSYKVCPNNIFYLKYHDNVVIDEKLISELIDLNLNTFKNQKFRSIVDFNGNTGRMNEEAKDIVANHEGIKEFKICEALLTDSFRISILIGIYIKVFKPVTSTKSFSDIDKATEWIMSFEI